MPPLEERPTEPEAEPPTAEEARPRRSRSAMAVPLPPAVIPLVHAPDDPGPEIEPYSEPAPEPEAPADRWGRLRQYFKP